MAITSDDIVSLSRARARLTELCEEVRSHGKEKIITRNGESCVALIDARRLDYYHRIEREHIHLGLLEEALRGLDDVHAGRTVSLRKMKARYGR
jgi:prevent-host-death family protein